MRRNPRAGCRVRHGRAGGKVVACGSARAEKTQSDRDGVRCGALMPGLFVPGPSSCAPTPPEPEPAPREQRASRLAAGGHRRWAAHPTGSGPWPLAGVGSTQRDGRGAVRREGVPRVAWGCGAAAAGPWPMHLSHTPSTRTRKQHPFRRNRSVWRGIQGVVPVSVDPTLVTQGAAAPDRGWGPVLTGCQRQIPGTRARANPARDACQAKAPRPLH